VILNLSCSRPDRRPQNKTSWARSKVGMLTMNSPDSKMISCEYLSGRMLMASRGGSALTGMIHATVIMLGFPVLPLLVIRQEL